MRRLLVTIALSLAFAGSAAAASDPGHVDYLADPPGGNVKCYRSIDCRWVYDGWWDFLGHTECREVWACY